MSKLSKFVFRLIDLIVIFSMTFATPIGVLAQDIGPSLSTDKTDYVPGDTVNVSGLEFTIGNYSLVATYPDASTVDWGVVAVNETLIFSAASPEAVTMEGIYEVTVYAEDQSTVVATASFTVTAPPPPPAEPEPLPFIRSDKLDYAPGELVTLTGGNWQGDTQVRIFVNDDLGKTWSRDVIVDVASDGTILDSFNLPNWFVASYVVSANGQQTGRAVITSFTDSQEDYKHYADKAPANWQNGALQGSNSQYFESEIVPHYWKTEGLVPGQYYGFNVYYDYYDTSSGGYCGFDYMAQYNISRNPPPVGSSPVPVYSIPGGPGTLFAAGAQSINAAGPFPSGIQRFIQIRFQATSSRAEFYWGFHLAQPGAISGCQGSRAWPGASLQTYVSATPQFTQFMLGGGGTLQINPKDILRGTISGYKWNDQNGNGGLDGAETRLANWPIRLCYDSACNTVIQTTTTDANGNYTFTVIPGTYFVREIQQSGWSQTWPPSGYYGPLSINANTPTYTNVNFGNRQGTSITIVKDSVPNHSDEFIFYGSFGNFPLDDDNDGTYPNSRTFGNISPGVYTVGEYVTGYWGFSGITCTGDNGNTIIYPGQPQVQIYLDPGENIVCTFTNTRRGTIIINKVANGGDATFNFTTTGGDGFPANFNIATSNGSGTQTFNNIVPGSYSVSETALQGWDLTNATCSTGTPGSFTVDPGATVTCTFTNTMQSPVLTLVKTATPTTYDSVGDTINYSYLVTNDGNIKLAGPVTVSDDKATVLCPDVTTVGNFDGFLDPGEAITCNASYSITQSDLDSGNVTNTAIATAGTTDSNEDSETVTAVQTPALTLEKTADPTSYDSVGNVINYSYLVTNTGNVRLAGPVTVADDKATVTCPDVNTVGNLDGYLDPGESVTCAASYTITQADLNTGSVTNTATAHASGTDSNTDSETVNAIQSPALTLVKTATPATYDSVGDVISYSYLVTNSGNVRLTGPVTVSDDKATVSCPSVSTIGNLDGFLDPGESVTCTASYTITQADINDGSVTNTATAHAGGTDSNPDTETVPATQSPAITLEKAVTSSGPYDSVGDVITYELVATNIGNVTLSDVSISDPLLGTLICTPAQPATLAPTGTLTCTGSYTVTQGDLDAGHVDNTATATGSFNGNDYTDIDSASVPTTQSAVLTLDKSVAESTYDSVGDILTYSYELINDGNVTLSAPYSVDDDKTTVTCPITPPTLAPGATVICSATFSVTQADLDAGSVTNIATGHAFFGATEIDSNQDSTTIYATQTPALTVNKTLTNNADEDGSNSVSLNDTLTYTLVAANTGNITLHNVVVSDSLTGDSTTCASVAPNGTCTLIVTYVVTQADVDAGNIHNVGTADSDETPPSEDPHDVPVPQNPALTLVKTATPTTYDEVGDVISYSYLVTNSGNVTLHDPITVTDDKAIVACPALPVGGLVPWASITCTATYIITQADLDAGSVTNSAYAQSGTTTSNTDTETVTAVQTPAIQLEKTVTSSGPYDSVGDVITYQLVATNIGNVTLTNVTISDPLLGTLTCIQPVTLAPTETLICTGSYIITQGDLDAGTVDNTATTSGTFNEDEYTDTDSASVPMTQNPSLSLEKTGTFDAGADGFADPGELITYTFVVTNTGNITLHNVTVTDPLVGLSTISCSDSTIPVGGSITCTATYAVTQADIDAGSVHNLATADSNESAPDEDDNTEPLPQDPSLSLSKTGTFDAGGDGFANPGELITYTFVVTNTGNITLHNVTVTDPLQGLSTIACDANTIPVGGFITCTATYAVTQADIDAGSVHNLATADSDESDEDTDDETVELPQNHALAVDKTANPVSMPEPGGLVTFTVRVNNAGNTTLTLTSLADDIYGDIADTLNPNLASTSCSVPQAIVVGGFYECTFSANVTGEPGTYTDTVIATANGETDSDDATVTLTDVTPSISVEKSANPTSLPEPGGNVTFSVVVTNNSFEAVTLTSLTDDVYGDLNGQGSCVTSGTIDPGESYSCSFVGAVTGEPGFYTDTITAIATDNDGTTDDDSASATVKITDVLPTVILEKTVDDDEKPEPGGVFTFTLTITNPSVEAVRIVALGDSQSGSTNFMNCIALNGVWIPAGGSVSCTYSVTHTDAGSYDNTANVTVKDNEENSASASDDETVNVTDVLPTVTLDKTALPTTLPEPGGVFTFTLTITNTSVENVTITGLGDTNVLSPENTPECLALVGMTLTPGQSVSCDYDVTHTDAGSYPNTAQVTVADNEGNAAGDVDSETVTVTDVLPTVDLVKTASPLSRPEPGGIFTFTLTITNTSVENVIITGLGDTNVLSPQNTPECLALVGTTLTPGQSVSCDYDVTHTDAGSYPNTAEVTVADNEGNPASDTDDETVTVTDVLPTVTLDKTALPTTRPEPGGVFTFTLTITNTSVENVVITGLGDSNVLSPENTPECLALVNTILSPGQSVSCDYDVTHTDAGSYLNTAQVTVADNEGNAAEDTDSETVTVTDVLPTITVTKTASPTSVPETGENVTFTFVVTNTSVEAVEITSLSDDQFGTLSGDADCQVGTILGVDASCTFSETHFIGGDFESGIPHTNVFTAHAKDNENNDTSDQDDATVDFTDVSAAIEIDKVTLDGPASGDGLNILTGESIQWRYTVTNLGNYPLSNISVTDSINGVTPVYVSGDTNNNNKLDLTETWIYEASGTAITGNYNNTGTAYGDFTDGSGSVESDTDADDSNYFGADPQLTINKVTVDGATEGDGLNILTGESIGWKYTITNTGNVTLNNVVVSDNQGVVISCPKTVLTVGEGMICTASGTANTGVYSNTGTTSGSYTDSAGHSRTDTETDNSSYFGADPQIALAKVTVDGVTSGDALTVLTGESIKWRYTVTNVGNIPLSSVTVTDSVSGVTPAYVSGDTNNNNKLDLTETWIFEASGTAVTGNYSNTGTVSGSFTDNAGHSRTDTASDGSSYFGADPQIAITKVTVDGATSGDGLNILTGETIKWRYTVTNVGNVALSNVTVTDNKVGVTPAYVSGDTNGNSKLDLTETWMFEASGTSVTGNYSNTGTASGKFTDDAGHSRTDTATDTSSYFGANPQIDIVKKTVGSDGTEGDNVFVLINGAVTWKYYVTNIGNVPLSNVTVTDNKPGVTVTCPKTSLAIGESMTCTATGTNTTPIGTWYNNIGTASGSYTDSAGHSRTTTDSDASSYYSQNPGMVTNSSLCDFGTSFRLVFTPDVKYYTSSTQAYKLSDSNPGQYFYNVFRTSGPGTVTLTIPYPFVTQGATPIHVYSSLTAVQINGETCLQPTNEIKNYQQTVTLGTYGTPTYPGGSTTVTLTGLPTTGFIYINMHMDYGLEKLNGWVKNGESAYYNSTINPTIPKVNIINNTQHTFTSSIPNSTDSISNTNEFKKVKGFGGLVYTWNSTLQQYVPVNAARVKLYKGTTLTAANLKETMTSDGDGWYLSTYVHSGKAATYTLVLLDANGNVLKKIPVTAGGSLKFGEGIFYIGGPTPTP